ncbi:metal dependent phosphohydrolase [Shewanella halifaxensis HAW-EB4]|uniref:Metal dependent phosphohydrolase n=1 Tax=Shewanella halifaxensis (strain HAW-EB4) TaxID=458817 RepID=B0TV28_SHEHH|nr:HD domain-containing phosphohydrolase [Shewanella halifaxensis]ABZ78295.1 metal dependent phosphohydrolase [Shewanella halifaxensis HAW-EB4]
MGGLEKINNKRFTIRVTVVGIFILATILTAAIAISLQYYFSKNMATDAAVKLYNLTAKNTSSYLTQVDSRAINTTQLLSNFDVLVIDRAFNPEVRQAFADVMQINPLFYGIYVGMPNGDFYELINLNAHPIIRKQLNASHLDRWVLISISGEGELRQKQQSYLDEQFNLRVTHIEPSEYDARARPWFVDAKPHVVSKTEPYLFQHLQSPGQTYSIKLADSGVVLALDIALSTLSDYLVMQGEDEQGINEKKIYLYKQSGELIASNQDRKIGVEVPDSKELVLTAKQRALVANTEPLLVSNETDWAPIDFAISGMPQGYSVDLLNLVADMTGLELHYINGFSWSELTENYKADELDMLHSVIKTDETRLLGEFSEPFLELPYALVTQQGTPEITHIEQLNGKHVAIPTGWSIVEVIRKNYPQIEIVEMASTYAILHAVEQGEVFAALDNSIILHYTAKQFFVEQIQYHEQLDFSPIKLNTGLHVVMPAERAELIAVINLALANITPEQTQALRAKWFGEGVKQTLSTQGTVPFEALIELAREPKNQKRLIRRELNGVEEFLYVTPFGGSSSGSEEPSAGSREYFAIVVPTEQLLTTSVEKVQQSILLTSLCLLIILPVSWLFSSPIIRPIKLLAIENDKIKHRRYDEVERVQTSITELDELAQSMMDMSSAIKTHEENQKELMESFIKLIAQAIDDKSPYTAGHCNRVPELGLMLAHAAENSDLAPFKDFKFNTDDEQREFRIAAWLHDCGKITTPEYIVDKGTKLEAVYNRIHEVRMRFEVLWRDAEIDYLKQTLLAKESGEQSAQLVTELTNGLTNELAQKRKQLKADFEFIAKANVGGEFMVQEAKDRLSQLAKISWQRHFDDRLGLSPVEELNLSERVAELSYPVTEPLLRDKPEHIIKRINKVEFDPKFGIKMAIPEYQYNLGELYNLSISRGTLTAEDRFKINEHVTSTIKMLENLPFPPELAKVPRYASTHHETLKGSGYPRKLSADELSIPERILVVADIFEALTAADRPYKKAKPLSVAIDILYKMALDEHLDMDIFKLFLSSGIYLDYAHKFLDSAQINEVDTAKYLHP